MSRSTDMARGLLRGVRGPVVVLAAALLCTLLVFVGNQTTRANGDRGTAASQGEFVSLVPGCACGRRTVLAAFSLQNGKRINTITPVRPVAGEFLSLTGGPSGAVVATATAGPRCTSNVLGCGPVPDTCSGTISVLTSHTFRPIYTAPDSITLHDAVESPDQQRLAMIANPCTRGTDTVLVRNLATRAQFSLAHVPRCSTLGAPAWSTDGGQLVFPFAADRPSPGLPAGVCPSTHYARLAIASADHPSSPAAWARIQADHGCSFLAATFDASGIAAVEGCRRAGLQGSASYPGFGQAVLLELNHRDHVTRRMNLQPGWEQGVITTEPSGAVLISQDQPANGPYPERDWVWELRDHHLRLIASYKALDAAEIIAIPR